MKNICIICDHEDILSGLLKSKSLVTSATASAKYCGMTGRESPAVCVHVENQYLRQVNDYDAKQPADSG